MRRFVPCLAAALLLLAGQARAGFVVGDTAASTDHLGNFTGSIGYSASSPTAATLTVSLTNTSPSANQGDLTGFVLKNPGDAITGIALSGPSGFLPVGAPTFQGGVNGAPFGAFDFGAAVGGNFLGGGNPNAGLAVGASGTFVFALTGTGLDRLTAAQFDQPQGAGVPFFEARFRGFADGGSDKVPGLTTVTTFGAVPEPSALALATLGVVGLAGTSLRKRPGASGD